MVCGGLWAWDSNELIQTEWTWADDENAINNKPTITLRVWEKISLLFYALKRSDGKAQKLSNIRIFRFSVGKP
jgi:hypothetical protein